MKAKNKLIIAALIMLVCLPILASCQNVFAITAITADQLPTNRGDQVTGDDIVNTGRYLYGKGFTYSNVGTCTGFVTRVLVHLRVGLNLVSRNDNWNYCYTDEAWDKPGYIYTAAWDPAGFKKQLDQMVQNQAAEYIGMIPKDSTGVAQTLGIQNGDLLITPVSTGGTGHVAFAYIEDGVVKTFGAASKGIELLNIDRVSSNKQGDIYVYRIAKAASGNLKIAKIDEHGVAIPGTIFHVTGPQIDQDYTTDENGIIELNNVAIGDYTVTEIGVREDLSLDTTPKNITVNSGDTTTLTQVNKYPSGKARIHKVYRDPDLAKGDTSLAGAKYNLYAAEEIRQGATLRYTKDQLVTSVETDTTGYSNWVEGLPVGRYYWKEVNAPVSQTLNEGNIEFDVTAGANADIASENVGESVELPKYNRAKVIKMDTSDDSSEKEIAVGAVIRLSLISNPNEYYDATIQEDGSAEFIDKEFKKVHPDEDYTIPYGRYKITEVKGSTKDQNLHTQFYIQEYELELTDNHKTETVVVADVGITPYIKVIKTDSDNGERVELAGAKFKIWDCQNNKFLEQFYTPKGEWISEFETNDEGYFITPTKVQPGKYIIYETQAPEGYVLNEKWKLPQNEEDYGVEGKGGKLIDLNKITLGLKDNEEFDPKKDVIYPVEMDDEEYKGMVEVHKFGEMITGTDQSTKTVYGQDYDVSTPKYEYKGLEGVEFTLTAKEDILSPDKKHLKVKKGTQFKITTKVDGYGKSDKLYCGTYDVEETVTPAGYIKETNLDSIDLVNDKTEAIQTTSKEYRNTKMPTEVSVEKSLEEAKYTTENEKIKVVLGIYSNEDIKTYDQKVAIKKNKLLDVVYGEIAPGNKMTLTSRVNLPEGKYYCKELSVDYPYAIDDTKYEVNVKFNANSESQVLKVKGPIIVNKPDTVTSLSIVKISTSCLVSENEKERIQGTLSEEQVRRLTSPIIDWMDGNSIDEIKAVLTGKKESTDSQIKNYHFKDYLLTEAEYTIYTDKDCKSPLLNAKTGKVVTVTTDSKGFAQLDELPLGEYWLKETKAPKFVYQDKEFVYNLDPNPTHIILDRNSKDARVCRALWDDMSYGKEVIKTDLLTGELVPNCTFEIRDEDGKIIVNGTTDSEGKYKMAIDLFEEGKTYTYTEIEAPDIYNIDTTPHEFTVRYDENGEIEKTEVTNTRKTRKVIVRKVDADTGDPLKGCVFTIAMIDPETGEQKVNAQTGEPIYLVQNVETDENGEYVIEDAPMGTYKFTEIKAPEGYELDEDLTGLVFTIDNNSPETIIFEVTNTGDIAVVDLVAVSIACIAGIVFISRKNKKLVK